MKIYKLTAKFNWLESDFSAADQEAKNFALSIPDCEENSFLAKDAIESMIIKPILFFIQNISKDVKLEKIIRIAI